MLLGAAEILAGMKSEIAGTVIFIFQPAEEGAPPGQVGGARRMMDEGVFADLKPDAIFGLHVVPGETGTLFYRQQGFMAASDRIDVRLRGKQTHGAWPWLGIDIVSVGAQVVNAVNAISARQADVRTPSVITLATVHAGVRYNIIPDELIMSGTMRTFDVAQRSDLQDRVRRTAGLVAESWGATAEVNFTAVAPLTYNDPALSAWLVPSLEQAAGAGKVNPAVLPTTVAEDFSVFQQTVPGVMYHLGISKPGQSSAETAPNHSPYFDVYEPALEVGVKAHVLSALNFLESRAAR
jgi:amidohydrolase